MRADLKKFLFVGYEKDRDEFFRNAQKEGLIQFINPTAVRHKEFPDEVQSIGNAIKVLRGLPPLKQEENFENLTANVLVDSILSLHKHLEELSEKSRLLRVEISRIQIYGNFSFDDLDYIEKEGKCKIQFFAGRPTLFQDSPIPEGLIFVDSEHGLDYYMAVNPQLTTYDRMIELKFDHSLSSLKASLNKTEAEHKKTEANLKQFAKFNHYLHDALIEQLNKYNLDNVQTYVEEVIGGSLFAIEGWVPVDKVEELEKIVGSLGVYAEEVAIEPTDQIPTCLENEGIGRLGEDLVHIYDTPSSSDDDPSKPVFYGFALFFAFIIGDAGYGLIYLLLALYLRYKFPNAKGAGKRFLKLFTFLSVACILWGTLMTSFFGMEIAVNNPLRKVSLLQWLAEKKAAYHVEHQDNVFEGWIAKYPELSKVKDPHQFVSFSPNGGESGYIILNRLTDNIMFEIALFVGVCHLIYSMARYAGRFWQNIGWILFLIGAYLYFPQYLGTPSLLNYVGGIDLNKGGDFGFHLMIGGITLAWGLSMIKHGWTGIFEVVTVIQVFADTLSYLRLYALGLAGAIVASTVNEIASGIPLILGIFLVLISHFINIILSTMSGVIHGLRLNFLEWYHYSFEGGGKIFQPLKLLKKD